MEQLFDKLQCHVCWFQPKIHKVTWLLICNLTVIYKNLRSQYKHLFQREEFAFGHEETCLQIFSTHCQPCQFRVFSMSLHRIFSFFISKVQNIFWKNRQTFIVLSLSKEGHVFDTVIFGESSLYSLLKHIPVFSCGISEATSDFILWVESLIYESDRCYQKNLLSKKKPFFLSKKLGNCLPFWADLKFRWFILAVF